MRTLSAFGSGPTALTKARLPPVVRRRTAAAGEKPPSWVTASATGPPRNSSTAARTFGCTSGHGTRLPVAGGWSALLICSQTWDA
ncbi:hypothetical protein ACFQ0B_04815 [Nonomuraea thailandensis]